MTANISPQGCTNFKLRQLLRCITQHYDSEMAKAGLKTTQYSLLSNVIRLGPVNPGKLAQAMKMDASTLTRNLKPLADAGWLKVEPGADGRTRTVTVTPAGQAKHEEARMRWKVAQENINQLLGVERVCALHALIDTTLEILVPTNAGADDDERNRQQQ